MVREATLAAAALVALATAANAEAPAPNAIVAEVHGLRNEKGRVDCYLYASPAGFPQDQSKAMRVVTAPISDDAAACRFEGVTPGAYALAVVHDEHATGKLERNFMGIPTNGVGASNDPPAHFGPPSFAASRFTYGGGEKRLVIHVRYLL